MELKDRIRILRRDLGLTQVEFSKRIFMSSDAVSMMERGVTVPTSRTVSLICSEFNVRREWLESGEGEMYDLPLDEEAAMFARLAKRTSASADALKLVIKCYLSLGDDGIAVLDKLIEQAIKDGHTKKGPED